MSKTQTIEPLWIQTSNNYWVVLDQGKKRNGIIINNTNFNTLFSNLCYQTNKSKTFRNFSCPTNCFSSIPTTEQNWTLTKYKRTANTTSLRHEVVTMGRVFRNIRKLSFPIEKFKHTVRKLHLRNNSTLVDKSPYQIFASLTTLM